MKFPKLPKSLERLVLGLAILAILMKPTSFGAITTTEGLLKKAAYTAVILGTYYVVGEKYGVYAAGAVAVFFWFQQTKEGMEVEGKAIEGTACPEKFNFDVAVQMCKDDKGALVKPTQVRCASGYKPNASNDKCIQDIPPDAPAPPPPGPPPGVEEPAPPAAETPSASSTGSATAETAAPAKTTEKFEGGKGKGTIATTPGAAQEAAQQTVVLQQQGGTEPFTGLGVGYPLQ
jgi:hypothetical protein